MMYGQTHQHPQVQYFQQSQPGFGHRGPSYQFQLATDPSPSNYQQLCYNNGYSHYALQIPPRISSLSEWLRHVNIHIHNPTNVHRICSALVHRPMVVDQQSLNNSVIEFRRLIVLYHSDPSLMIEVYRIIVLLMPIEGFMKELLLSWNQCCIHTMQIIESYHRNPFCPLLFVQNACNIMATVCNKIVDKQDLIRRFGGDQRVFLDILQNYFDDSLIVDDVTFILKNIIIDRDQVLSFMRTTSHGIDLFLRLLTTYSRFVDNADIKDNLCTLIGTLSQAAIFSVGFRINMSDKVFCDTMLQVYRTYSDESEGYQQSIVNAIVNMTNCDSSTAEVFLIEKQLNIKHTIIAKQLCHAIDEYSISIPNQHESTTSNNQKKLEYFCRLLVDILKEHHNHTSRMIDDSNSNEITKLICDSIQSIALQRGKRIRHCFKSNLDWKSLIDPLLLAHGKSATDLSTIMSIVDMIATMIRYDMYSDNKIMFDSDNSKCFQLLIDMIEYHLSMFDECPEVDEQRSKLIQLIINNIITEFPSNALKCDDFSHAFTVLLQAVEYFDITTIDGDRIQDNNSTIENIFALFDTWASQEDTVKGLFCYENDSNESVKCDVLSSLLQMLNNPTNSDSIVTNKPEVWCNVICNILKTICKNTQLESFMKMITDNFSDDSDNGNSLWFTLIEVAHNEITRDVCIGLICPTIVEVLTTYPDILIDEFINITDACTMVIDLVKYTMESIPEQYDTTISLLHMMLMIHDDRYNDDNITFSSDYATITVANAETLVFILLRDINRCNDRNSCNDNRGCWSRLQDTINVIYQICDVSENFNMFKTNRFNGQSLLQPLLFALTICPRVEDDLIEDIAHLIECLADDKRSPFLVIDTIDQEEDVLQDDDIGVDLDDDESTHIPVSNQTHVPIVENGWDSLIQVLLKMETHQDAFDIISEAIYALLSGNCQEQNRHSFVLVGDSALRTLLEALIKNINNHRMVKNIGSLLNKLLTMKQSDTNEFFVTYLRDTLNDTTGLRDALLAAQHDPTSISYAETLGLRIQLNMISNPDDYDDDALVLDDDDQVSEFRCPISGLIMENPVLLCDGFSYEESRIEPWLKAGNLISPCTRLPLKNNKAVPNYALRAAIEEWKRSTV